MSTSRFLDHPYLLAGRRIDPITGTLSYREVQKHLRRKELEVLALLAEAGTDHVPRSVFMEQVWQGNSMVGEQGLTDTIAALRRSLQDSDRDNPLIQTIPRRGYRLHASARLISRDRGVAFVAGAAVDGRPGWHLKQLIEQTDAFETWLAEDGRARRIFRFCRNEQQLRKLRREVVLMRYLREALAGREDVSTILDWQLEDPPYFLELAAPACGNLRGVMLGEAAPELAERWRLLQRVAEALAAVHAVGVVHRNLSPESVLVDRHGSDRVAMLGEFGLATLDDRQRLSALGIDPAGLSLNTVLSDPATAYTAPECVAGTAASAASDIYALGVLIGQAARGDFRRLESTGFDTILPAELSLLIAQCATADPAARPTAAEVALRLEQLTPPMAAAPRAEEPSALPSVRSGEAQAQQALAQVNQPAVSAHLAPAAMATIPEPAAPSLYPAQLTEQRIGRYRILEELAQGGMGVIYLAEQSEPVQRKVALKLIRAGMDSAQVLARFGAERQALAMMNHPNISAIFDAGTTPSGHPYFAMEFVPGKDIKSHCDQAKLNLGARVRLFLQVCDGVLHAHQRGLLHRDLKPSNILVKQKSDQSAVVKVIDFGVAKSLTVGLSAGLHTRIGSFIGTPVYSSPEQVTDPTRDIDTRADIYSLGIVLYELLTGVTPVTSASLECDTPSELARRLRSVRIPACATRFGELESDQQRQIAAERSVAPGVLVRQLAGDLNWILQKCTATDPEERYATVRDLARDLNRWLDQRPIDARPRSFMYQLQKLVRRHPINTSVICLLSAALVFSSIFTFHAKQDAEEAQARAETERAAAEQTLTLFTGIINAGNPRDNKGNKDPTIREVIAKGTLSLKDRRDIPIGVRDRLYFALAQFHYAVGDYQSIADLNEQLMGDPDATRSIKVAALHRQASGYRGMGNAELAIRAAQESLTLSQDPREGEPIEYEVATSQLALGVALSFAKRNGESVDYLTKSLESFKKISGDRASDTLMATFQLGFSLNALGRYSEAAVLLREAVKINRELGNSENYAIIPPLAYLGNALANSGAPEEGLKLHEEALSLARRLLGDKNPEILVIRASHATGLESNGLNLDARAERRAVLDGMREFYKPDSYFFINALLNSGRNFLREPLEIPEGMKRFEAALEILSAKTDVPSQDRVIALRGMAVAKGQAGMLDEALGFIEDAARQQRLFSSEQSIQSALTDVAQATIFLAAGRHAEAMPMAHHAIQWFGRYAQHDQEKNRLLVQLDQLLRRPGCELLSNPIYSPRLDSDISKDDPEFLLLRKIVETATRDLKAQCAEKR